MRIARVALWIFVMTVVVLAWGSVRMAVIHSYQFDGPSMEPTFAHEDRVLVDQTAYGLSIPAFDGELLHWAQPERGGRSPVREIRSLVKKWRPQTSAKRLVEA